MSIPNIEGQILKLALMGNRRPSFSAQDFELELAGNIKPGARSGNPALAAAYGERDNFVFRVLEYRQHLIQLPPNRMLDWFQSGVSLERRTAMIGLYDACVAGVTSEWDTFFHKWLTDCSVVSRVLKDHGWKTDWEELMMACKKEGELKQAHEFLQSVPNSDPALLAECAAAEYQAMGKEFEAMLDAVTAATALKAIA